MPSTGESAVTASCSWPSPCEEGKEEEDGATGSNEELIPEVDKPCEELEEGKGQGPHVEAEEVEEDEVEDQADKAGTGAQPSLLPPRRTRLSTTAASQSTLEVGDVFAEARENG